MRVNTCGLYVYDCIFQPNNETALHLAIEEEDNRSLYMVDFITQNSNG